MVEKEQEKVKEEVEFQRRSAHLLFKFLVVCVFMSTRRFGPLPFQNKCNDLKEKDRTDIKFCYKSEPQHCNQLVVDVPGATHTYISMVKEATN